jgi:membrane fusion protein (multidrug efflux system)
MNSTATADRPLPEPIVYAPAAKRKWLRTLLLAIIVPVALFWAGRVVIHMFTHEETDDAYVTAPIHTISSRIAGVVDEVLVEENTFVKKGQPIIKLDTRDLDLRLQQARASEQQEQAMVAQAEARLADSLTQDNLVKAGIELAKAFLARDEANAAKARADFERAEALMTNKDRVSAISQADFDAAKTTQSAANSTVTAMQAGLEAAKAYVSSVAAKQKAAEAERDAAKAQLRVADVAVRDAELQLTYATITAPADGLISRKNVEVGNRIQPGQAVFALVDPKVWIQANFKETQVAKLRVGQPVEITVDALPGHPLAGHIESFAPASGAQFSLLPPDNATGNFTKIVQRVPVKIVFEEEALQSVREQVRPGLSAVVSIAVK